MLNTFGTIRNLQYFNNTQGTGKEGTVYGSKDVGLTGSSLLNYIENAIFDTNQMRYYSPEKGLSDALYEQRRDLSNLMQKLGDQGYTIPSSSELNQVAKTTASVNTKGKSIINNAIAVRTNATNQVSSSSNISIADTVKLALEAGGYKGVVGGNVMGPRNSVYAPRNNIYVKQQAKGSDKIVEFGSGTYIDKNGNDVSVNNIFKGMWGKEKKVDDNGNVYRQFITTSGREYYFNQEDGTLAPWHETSSFEKDLADYKIAYTEWKNSDTKSKTWWEMYEQGDGYTPQVYNEMVLTNFDSEKLKRWFELNPSKISWKQTIRKSR